jgi:hypothetical protein
MAIKMEGSSTMISGAFTSCPSLLNFSTVYFIKLGIGMSGIEYEISV